MGHELIDSEQVFDCDLRGCNQNTGYDADIHFVDAWSNACSKGWGSIDMDHKGKWKILCPDCARKIRVLIA